MFVAVFGASETPGSVGRALMTNLLHDPFGGVIFPINPRRPSVLGVKAYTGLAALPCCVDLALIATPAATVPDVLGECQAAGVKAAVIYSAGFGDSGPAGAELERQVRRRIQPGAMRVVGANSLGVACPRTRFNATFAPGMAPPGQVGFLSQSGALLTGLLAQEHSAQVGCSAFVSVGSLVDVGWAEWIDYLAGDPHTRCLGLYVEHLDDPHAFFTAARAAAAHKPVVLIKGGAAPDEPAADEVFAEACACSGVLRVQRLIDLFRMAAYLTSRPAAAGRRLAVLTNARGPAVLAADALHADGGSLAEFAPETVTELAGVLPPRWNRQNPIDVGDDADAGRLGRAAAVAVRDPNTDALLVLLAPHAGMDPVRAAEELGGLAQTCSKPVLACWMWAAANPASLAVLRNASVPSLHSPEGAVRTFGYLWRHTENLHCLAALREVLDAGDHEALDFGRAAAVFAGARQRGGVELTDAEVRELFAAYNLVAQERRPVADAAEALQAAAAFGYPVAVEMTASAVAGPDDELLRLQATDPDALRRAVRLLEQVAGEHLGANAAMVVRPTLAGATVEVSVSGTSHKGVGPVIRLGEGGRPTEAPRRASLGLAPLTPRAARELIEQSRLPSLRGHAEELGILEQFLVRLGRLLADHADVKKITIAHLRISPLGALAREVRVVLHEAPMP
jgi:acetyltransferase